ncbi:hypothetical protein TTHT_0780 [Thermotomaculum hydrothermale]|uniref:DUF4124 domain-containing protein n=1 Tax=Thermotomaculum hydrothermale TaxID=981385 RepID=A0A7R6PNI0_9BACT|nr:hypothetical protein [Thermotomaculum hydrothermale]BBB32346.1 hypothetical protein TTHT_0780 [Thermotomaculum hydrothermale]
MKKTIFFLFIIFISFSAFSDVYKYKDEKGRVYFVDSIYQVPLNYRKNMEILPSGKDVNREEKFFADIFLNKDTVVKAGNFYYNFIFSKIKPLLVFWLIVFVIFLILMFKIKDFLWILNLLLLFLILTEGIYLFGVYPAVKRGTIVYSYLTTRFFNKSMSVSERVKKYALENAVAKNPLPLNPYSYYLKTKRLKEFYNKISLEVSIGNKE